MHAAKAATHVRVGSNASDQHAPDALRMSAMAPIATQSVRRNEPSRCAPCVDGSELARTFLTPQAWSVQPCVRPVCAVHMTAGHNALRGSGPGQKPAFENAVAQVGCPDRRIDRLCITCCSSSPTFTSRQILGAISLRPERDRIIISLAARHQCPGHSSKLVGKRDSCHFGRPSSQ